MRHNPARPLPTEYMRHRTKCHRRVRHDCTAPRESLLNNSNVGLWDARPVTHDCVALRAAGVGQNDVMGHVPGARRTPVHCSRRTQRPHAGPAWRHPSAGLPWRALRPPPRTPTPAPPDSHAAPPGTRRTRRSRTSGTTRTPSPHPPTRRTGRTASGGRGEAGSDGAQTHAARDPNDGARRTRTPRQGSQGASGCAWRGGGQPAGTSEPQCARTSASTSSGEVVATRAATSASADSMVDQMPASCSMCVTRSLRSGNTSRSCPREHTGTRAR